MSPEPMNTQVTEQSDTGPPSSEPPVVMGFHAFGAALRVGLSRSLPRTCSGASPGMTGVEPSARQVCHLRAKPNDGKPKERRAEGVRSFGLALRSQGGEPPRQRAGALCTML